MVVPVFRFAPSPNGRLHLGHAYSALLNQRMARDAGGRLLLRIEDTDLTRCRPEFISGILEDLRWLGLSWEKPVRIQSEHFADYEANLEMLWRDGAIYPCFCSRKAVADQALASADPDGQFHYAGTCRGIPRSVATARITGGDVHGWRIDMQACHDAAASMWGDVNIAKPRVGSWYHIAVVTDDALQGITHVVRGKDLEAATPLHKLLQRLLDLPVPCYTHHDLIHGNDGQKLAKRIGSESIADLRASGVTAEAIRSRLGFV